MMDVQFRELQDDELEFSPEELKEMAQSAFVTKLFTSYGKDAPENFGWNLNAGEKEVLYKRDKSIEVFDRLYQI